MDKRKNVNSNKKKLADIITDMVDEGSEGITTLSKDPEAKYESIGEKIPEKTS